MNIPPLRRHCSAWVLLFYTTAFFKKRRGPFWSHERTPQYNQPDIKVYMSIYLSNKFKKIYSRGVEGRRRTLSL